MIVASVIVPTYNRLPRLKEVLKALEKQSYPLDCFEVIVVSDGSQDGTNEYLQALDTPLIFRAIVQENQGVAAARNTGWKEAVGDLIIFVDDDVVPFPDLVAEHIRSHQENGDNLVLIGPMLTPANFQMSPWVQWEQSKLTEQYEDFVAGRRKLYPKYFYTGNSSLAKSHLLTVGGFDQQFRRAEDVELAYRLKDIGLTFEFNMAASGYHYAERSFASWITIPYEYGRNDVLFAKLKGHTWMIRTNIWEYLNRHLFIKVLVWLCLDRPLLTRTALRFLTVAAKVGHRYQLAKVYLLAYSGIFNMRHFQGFSDEYGGRTAFFDGVKRYIKGDFPE